MAQQINLCAPILLTQKKYFSAHTMAASLVGFVLVGTALLAAWVWNLQTATAQYQTTMQTQARDIANLQAALARSKAAAKPLDTSLSQQLEQRKQDLALRQSMLTALMDGTPTPGNAYSDRLLFLATTVPAPVWITGVTLASGQFQVAGYTLEPAALNDWVTRMATHPLLQGLQLSDVQVQNMLTNKNTPSPANTPAVPALAAGRPVWSFALSNSRPADSATPSGGHQP